MKIAMHQLKAGLSRYVALARAGNVIEVTSHDALVARIVGVPASTRPGIDRLLARGAAQWRGSKPDLKPPVRIGTTVHDLAKTIVEDRG